MNAVNRQRDIARLAEAEGFVSVEALASRYAVSAQTIRRDINLLCDRGVLRRFHGGAGVPSAFAAGGNLAYAARQVMNLAEKRRIAALVAADIPDGASISIGIGTTLEQVALALHDRRNLMVFTNNLNAAAALCTSETCSVTIAGGRLRNLDRDVVGDPAVAFFGGFKVDFAIFGVGGIDEVGALLDFTVEEVRARQAMAANARRILLVADSTKFGRNAVVRGGALGEAVALYTDRPIPMEFAAMVRDSGADVRIAPGWEVGAQPAAAP